MMLKSSSDRLDLILYLLVYCREPVWRKINDVGQFSKYLIRNQHKQKIKSNNLAFEYIYVT